MKNSFHILFLCAALMPVCASLDSYAASAVCATPAASVEDDITASDNMLAADKYQECRKILEGALPRAAEGHEKAEVLWRLARIQLIIGQNEPSKESRRAIFGKGVSYAWEGVQQDGRNEKCYMWHCANVGRECQTRSLTEQVKAVPVMTDDLTKILDVLGKVNYSEAWQALAEIYYNHPFKSNDAAINFTRKAAMCIPKGEMRLSTYALLAKMLYERNLSSAKRTSSIEKAAGKFKEQHKTAIDKYTWYEGSLGAGYKHVWSSKSLGEMSDREEASALVAYALSLYRKASIHTKTDEADCKDLELLKSKLK